MINPLKYSTTKIVVTLSFMLGGTSFAADTDPMDIAAKDVEKLMHSFSESSRINTQSGGKEIYASLCAACHMPRGEGARGSGFYPPLAQNKKLAAGAYPITVVLAGFHGMPSFAHRLNNEQIAAVVNYLRTNFDNHYNDNVTANQVAKLRQQVAPDPTSSYD